MALNNSVTPLAHFERAVRTLPAQQTLRAGPFSPTLIRGYVFALIAFVIAFMVRWWLNDMLPPGFPFITFFPAVVLIAFVFGRYPGILSAICAAVASWHYFLPGTPGDKILPIAFYIAIVSIDIAIIDLMHRALYRVGKMQARASELATERSLLVREIHHRVGNSLALVASLLRLHRSDTGVMDTSAVLKDAESRVLAISKVQAILYANDQINSVALDKYLEALIVDLKASVEDDNVELRLATKPISIEHDRAIALGLIATELVINSKKHAFPNGKGTIGVTLTEAAGDVELVVSDNGVGKADMPAENSTGVGSKIIAAMAHKLNAEVKTTAGNNAAGQAGMRTAVTFALDRTITMPL